MAPILCQIIPIHTFPIYSLRINKFEHSDAEEGNYGLFYGAIYIIRQTKQWLGILNYMKINSQLQLHFLLSALVFITRHFVRIGHLHVIQKGKILERLIATLSSIKIN
jgi:hypothetical protein